MGIEQVYIAGVWARSDCLSAAALAEQPQAMGINGQIETTPQRTGPAHLVTAEDSLVDSLRQSQ